MTICFAFAAAAGWAFMTDVVGCASVEEVHGQVRIILVTRACPRNCLLADGPVGATPMFYMWGRVTCFMSGIREINMALNI